jgi:imidazole glycerol phosphate synthase subunit HisF
VFTGPGLVENGAIQSLPLKQTKEELRESLLICTAAEMVERLQIYEELGVDELIINTNIGHSNEECLESLERFAADVMPSFAGPTVVAGGTVAA